MRVPAMILVSALFVTSAAAFDVPPPADPESIVRGVASAALPTTPLPQLKWARKPLGPGYLSSVAVGPDGRPHVVYARYSPSLRLTHSWHDGKKWRTEKISPAEEATENAVAVDAAGGVHVAYSGYDSGPALRYAYKAPGGVWTLQTVKIADSREQGSAISIAADAAGIPHISLVSGSAVRYLKKTAGGWEGTEVAGGASYSTLEKGTFLILRDATPYLLYSVQEATSRLMLATNGSGDWVSEEVAAGDTIMTVSGAFDGPGNLHLAYLSGTAMKHSWEDDGVWQQETLASPSLLFGAEVPEGYSMIPEHASLASDLTGRLHLAFGLSVSKAEAWGEALVYAYRSGEEWLGGIIATDRIGFNTSMAANAQGIPYVVTRKALGGERSSIVHFGLKGKKLSMTVKPKHKGTVAVASYGKECSGSCSEAFFPGTRVTLTAEPAAGQEFVGWSGACTGTGECTVTLDINRKVTAKFRAVPNLPALMAPVLSPAPSPPPPPPAP